MSFFSGVSDGPLTDNDEDLTTMHACVSPDLIDSQ